MPAQNVEQVTQQIKDWKAVCLKELRAAQTSENAIEQDVVVAQNWNNLATDFPQLVDGDGSILIDGVRQTFDAQAIAQAEKAIKGMQDYLEATTVDSDSLAPGTQVVEVLGVPLERLRALLDSGLV